MTAPDRPPFCPPDEAFIAHSIDEAAGPDAPIDAAADAPDGWVAVRGSMHVDREDGFVQLCAEVAEGTCVDGVRGRGVDNIGFLINEVRAVPGPSACEEPQVWLLRIRDRVIDDPAGILGPSETRPDGPLDRGGNGVTSAMDAETAGDGRRAW